MTPKAKIILLCGTPGLDLNSCARLLAESAREHSHECLPEPVCTEEFIPPAAASRLVRTMPEGIESFSLVDALGLPYDELVASANDALSAALFSVTENLTNSHATSAVLTLHPVLYHQRTSEFITPYSVDRFAQISQQHAIVRIVSIHDDVYDVYRRLMRRGRLFDPRLTRVPSGGGTASPPVRRREPLRDLQEQRLLLDWRDRELAASSTLSAQLGVGHLLFHRKGRLGALRRILFDMKRPVYLSHPISQPRSDITNIARPGKNETPDRDRGKALQRAIEGVANRLSAHVPLVEPTAIDEYRIDDSKWQDLVESDLRDCILPPLTQRWPSTKADMRLGGVPDGDEEEEVGGLPRVAESVFESVQCNDSSLEGLKGASDMLKCEILRQINVRDHVLAEQAGIVVAFRPYALPEGFEPTGGVEKEIEAQERMAALNPAAAGKIIIVHPETDERRRRRNQFISVWTASKASWFEDPDGALTTKLSAQLADRIEQLPIATTPQDVKRELLPLVKDAVASGLRMRQQLDDSSMTAGTQLRYSGQPERFLANVLRNSEILESILQVRARRSPDLIEFHISDTVTAELAKYIGALA